jgi:phosphopantothenoylcysteine decarboxylase
MTQLDEDLQDEDVANDTVLQSNLDHLDRKLSLLDPSIVNKHIISDDINHDNKYDTNHNKHDTNMVGIMHGAAGFDGAPGSDVAGFVAPGFDGAPGFDVAPGSKLIDINSSELVPIPTNLQSSILPIKPNASVKFNEEYPQERSRRFTILSQPSAIALANLNINQPQSRKTSIQDRKDGLILKHDIQKEPISNKDNKFNKESSSRYSPEIPSPRFNQNTFDLNQKRYKSPSPPPPFNHDDIEDKRNAFKTVPTISSSPAHSRRNSSDPINISRKSSIKKNSKKIIVASPIGPPVPFQQFLTFEDDGKFHILLACTGSVATIKVPLIIDKLFKTFGESKVSIQLVVTKSATHFLKGLKIHNDVKIWRDEDEWANYEYSTTETTTCKKPKNPFDKMILHNELRRWADIMLIAPLSANTIAKIANGIADNLLTNIIRAWGPQQSNIKKPILAAPAMNTFMYIHPITAKQLAILRSPDWFGIEILKPVEKVLVCGDIGMGGMREWSDIVDILRRRIISIKHERAKLDGEIEVDDDLSNLEEDDGDEGDEDDDDEDDDDDDEDNEDEDDNENENEIENDDVENAKQIVGGDNNNPDSHKQDSSSFHENGNDEDDLIFDITDQECEGKQIEHKLSIPRETQNIL